MVLVNFSSFDLDLVRFLGSAITVFLAALVLQRLAAPQVLLALARREARVALRNPSTGREVAPLR